MIRVFALIAAAPLVLFAAPCTTVAGCSEWVLLGDGPARSLIYRTYPLQERNEAITRALVIVHGAGRDADNYFRTALAAAFLAGALENTIVIAPRFASVGGGCGDKLDTDEVNWPCNGDSWRSGGIANGNPKLSSYDFMDEILRRLAHREVFPNLKEVVVAGHSAGGQFVNRYEMANLVHDSLGVPVRYVVSNPSSYGYPDSNRPTADGKEFRPFSDARNCTTYDRWPYGFQNRTGYAGKIPDEQLRRQLATRPTTYLLGQLDVLPLAGFDGSCPAMAQGATRLARGQAFVTYANQMYGAKHKAIVVELCGHNARCMFTAETALPVLFPK
jgi:hypothetical protein